MFWRAVAAIAGFSLIVFGLSSLDDKEITTAAQRSVAIATLPCAGIQSNSTGVVIDDRTVLTVAHAIHESRDFALRDVFGRWHRADLVRLDLENDLAILHVDRLRATPMEFAPRRSVDDWVGARARMLNGTSTGNAPAQVIRRVQILTEVVGDRSTQSKRPGFEVSLDIGPGDSGAALVDESDRLLAVVFARSKRREAVTWATATDPIDVTEADIPSWDCGYDPGVPLVLTEAKPTRLAG